MTTHRTYALTDKGNATADQIRRGYFAVADLTDRHFGKEVAVAGLTGTLVSLVPVGTGATLAMVVGGAHIWTDLLPGDTAVDLIADLCTWCDAGKHEKCRGADACGCTCGEEKP